MDTKTGNKCLCLTQPFTAQCRHAAVGEREIVLPYKQNGAAGRQLPPHLLHEVELRRRLLRPGQAPQRPMALEPPVPLGVGSHGCVVHVAAKQQLPAELRAGGLLVIARHCHDDPCVRKLPSELMEDVQVEGVVVEAELQQRGFNVAAADVPMGGSPDDEARGLPFREVGGPALIGKVAVEAIHDFAPEASQESSALCRAAADSRVLLYKNEVRGDDEARATQGCRPLELRR